ncbi:gamma-glutamylcyclotransferase 2-3 isoform X5 [Macadamia integrifolia]|uniref:gamma-glutamylcyclotransferase 2-3 isoform X5 n=1 Tax=Macadamia integrifolia TaxID=60698 RepID=UPI001C4FFECF|nr:gamma-glutamylcyclotransferase 2-3 isoform X5 [Macadamia integrifolia]
MVLWVFGYGSLIWKAGFHYDDRLIGFIKGYHRVFYQGSTDHRGTPEYPGRTVTLEPCDGEVCWGVAYKVSGEEDEQIALTYLEVREKQYDMQVYLDLFTEPDASTPAVSGILVQIVHAEGPSGPNRDYVFQLEKALLKLGCEDKHVMELAETVRQKLSGRELTNSQVE